MKKDEKISNRAEKLQKELHGIIKIGNKVSKAEYNDFLVSYLLYKIASLEIKLEEKEKNKTYSKGKKEESKTPYNE